MEVLSANAGVVGTVTHGMLHAGTHGHVKADDNDAGANVGMCESCGAGDRHRRRVVRMRERMEMGKSRCV